MTSTTNVMKIELFNGDCLTVLNNLAPQSVDMVFADLPYGTTACKWDSVIPFESLWDLYNRVCKPGAAITLTASQPFTSTLIVSNPGQFRCEWVWDKVNPTNFANAKRQPMKVHESVLVFSKRQTVYNPQKTIGAKNHVQGRSTVNASETRRIMGRVEDDLSALKYPRSIQTFPKHSSQCGLHPTQKPVELVEYFLRTYSNPGDTILDNTMGSGTTGVACVNLGRNFIGVEKDPEYFKVADKRIWNQFEPDLND
jgi:site-specific DNA-methyltransferase (adenine-specific)